MTQTLAGSATWQPRWPVESAQQVLFGLSRQVQSVGQSALAVHAFTTATQAKVPVGAHVHVDGDAPPSAEGATAGVPVGASEAVLGAVVPVLPGVPPPVAVPVGAARPGSAVPVPLDPVQVQDSCSLHSNPAPQSDAVWQGSSHRAVQRRTVVLVQVLARSSAGAVGSVQVVFAGHRFVAGGGAGQSTTS